MVGNMEKNRSERYVATVKTRLDCDILPAIGATKIDQLKARELTTLSPKFTMIVKLPILRDVRCRK